MTNAIRTMALVGIVMVGAASCSPDDLLNSDKLPPDVSDPAITRTPAGARAAYNGTIAAFDSVFGGRDAFVATAGVLTDELRTTFSQAVDQRSLPDGSIANDLYALLQRTRNQASQAIMLLTRYLPEEPALAGRLYALQGYTELFLAELYCSGIPLSILDYAGDFTYRPGSATTEVLTHATALFDTALTLAGDSTRFADLARVGKGRALLGLDSLPVAAAAVAAVADAYRYDVRYNNIAVGTGSALNFAYAGADGNWIYTVSDREGSTGLDWRMSGDPRTTADSIGYVNRTSLITAIYHPRKYALDGASSIVLASGVEARLIAAEAALRAGDPAWLATLNALRTDGTFDLTATSPPDTLWHAGSGGVAGLKPLADPDAPTAAGPTAARVDLLFRERAFWLFLTGHRQGDLRRLIRQYGRNEAAVYPGGIYDSSVPLFYGSDVTLPTQERNNPLYTGCASRGA